MIRFLQTIAVLSVLASAATAHTFEVGGFLGYHAPISQDDTSDDLTLGARFRTPIGSPFHFETTVGYYNMDQGPYRIRTVIQEVRTWYILSGSANLVLGTGFGETGYHPYLSAGVGAYYLRNEDRDDTTRPGLRGAIGMVAGMAPNLSIDASASLIRIALDGGGSRGLFDLSIGVNYHLGAP